MVTSKIDMEKAKNHPSTNIIILLRAREISGKMRRRDVPRLPHMFRNMSLLHSNKIFARQLLYDKTGERYVICRNGCVELFSARDGSLIGELDDSIGYVSNISLSDDNELIAAISDNCVGVWRLHTLDLVALTSVRNDLMTSVFFLTKAQQCYLAVVTLDAITTFVPYDDEGDKDIQFYYCFDGIKQAVEFQEEAGFSSQIGAQASLSPCGRYLLVGCFYISVFTVDIQSGCPVCLMNVMIESKPTTNLRFLTQYITRANWSRNGEGFILTVANDNRGITLWSLTEDRKSFAIKGCFGWDSVVTVCWDARDVYVITTHVGEKLMLLWDPNTGKLVNEVRTECEIVYLVAHPIDEGIVVSFYRNKKLAIWDMLASTPLVIYQTSIMSQPTCCIWSPRGDQLLVAEDNGYVSTYSCNAGLCCGSRIFEDELENSDATDSDE